MSKNDHYKQEYKGFKIDPYRIAIIYGIGNYIQFHMLKKLLRGTNKGHSVVDLIDELQCCLDRWREIEFEDSLESRDLKIRACLICEKDEEGM